MSYVLTCPSTEGYLRICVSGIWPSRKAEDIIADIHNLWTEHQDQPLMIDIRSMEDSPSVFSDYENAKLFAADGFYLIRRIAVLDNVDRREANNFFETTAHNRGIRFRFFYADEQEAISWLLTKEQEQT